MIKLLFSVILFLLSYTVKSSPSFLGAGLGPAKDMDVILSANPPLPMLNYQENTYKVGVQPTYYKGKNEFILFENDFQGHAFALNYSYAHTNKWGLFANFNYTHFSSDHTTNVFLKKYYLSNITSDFYTLSGGIHFQLLKQKGALPSINFIGGPYLKLIKFSQSYRREDFNKNIELDFDMESNPTIPGLMIGGQMGWKIKDKFIINPFGFIQIPISSECKSYEVTSVRKDSNNEAGKGTCPETGENGIDFSMFQISGGINLVYIPWDLSVNITAPFIRLAIEDYTNGSTTIISISKSFGDFER
ncbi:MAG: hypothetical protein OEY33_01520 [Bdellovibrionales bacterium]|nr:hypothetical protein [Bdellovibrionales bacterium]